MYLPKNLRERVDVLVRAQKHITGMSEWKRTDYEGQWRWLSPLSIDGVLTNMNLIVDAYPRSSFIKFHINLIYMVSVQRLDYSEEDRHNDHSVKGVPFPAGARLGWIYGPHCHRWEDNRTLATGATLPKELEFAVEMPQSARGFDNAFRWFCGDANIVVAANQMPVLPAKDTLL